MIAELAIVISGSSDKDIRIWNLSKFDSMDFPNLDSTSKDASDLQPPTTRTGIAPPAAVSFNPVPFLSSLKSHTRPVECLASYPIQANNADSPNTTGRFALVSADTLGALKTWEICLDHSGNLQTSLKSEIRPHEIGIYDLKIGSEEIWTASADNSILMSKFDSTQPELSPEPSIRIIHPYHVKSILSLPTSLPSLSANFILTGSSDESIRIFSLDSLSPESHPALPWSGLPLQHNEKIKGLVRQVEGHSHDVIELGVYTQIGSQGKLEAWILSASVDGTLRRWKWPEMLQPVKETHVIVQEDEAPQSLLTEEEERELAELMADD